MEHSEEVVVSPKKIKRTRWGPAMESSSLTKESHEESGKVIPNGTGNTSSNNLPEEETVKNKPKAIKITKITKSKTEIPKETIKSPGKAELSGALASTPCDSPTSSQSADNGFFGFDSVVLSEKQSEKQDAIHRILNRLSTLGDASSSGKTAGKDNNIQKSNGQQEEEMTVDTVHAIDSDSDHMEIDMGNEAKDTSSDFSEKHNTSGERTKDTDVDIMEIDSVGDSGGDNVSRNDEENKTDNKVVDSSIPESSVKGNQAKIEYCGGCGSEVDDAEEGICCDGKCERWFHLRCSGLTQVEYDELGRDENAKWACTKCSGTAAESPTVPLKADAKPLLSVRKDLAQPVTTPSPAAKRKSAVKEGGRTPKIDISNPAFLKPFDFGWKRELVFRSTNDTHNRRQGDIYYYTPQGKKLRSLREISDHLAGTELTQDNFTFWKEPLGIDDPQKEIIRDAKFKLVHKDPTASPTEPKKIIPKITKTPKVVKTTPKLTATVTPLDSSSVTPTTPVLKASASVTPRVVLKGKTGNSTGPKFKVTPSKNTIPGQTNKIVISKGAENALRAANKQLVTTRRKSIPLMANPAIANLGKTSLKDDNLNKRNNFKRYGLLANAKAPLRKMPTLSMTSSSSSSDNSSDDSSLMSKVETELRAVHEHRSPQLGIPERLRPGFKPVPPLHGQYNRGNSKVPAFNSAGKRPHYNKMAGGTVIHPLLKSGCSDKITLPLKPDGSLIQSKPSPPDIQFRPSNPSSYGCQTSSPMSRTSRPASSLFHTNVISCSTAPFEAVYVVDNTSTVTTASQRKNTPYESPLIFNTQGSPFEIVKVESLNSKVMNNYETGYLLGTSSKQSCSVGRKRSPVLVMNDGKRNESFIRNGTELSPISIGSSSTEEIVVVDEDDSNTPPFLIRNSPPPKLTRNVSSPNRSPPNLRPILPPPPLVLCPQRTNTMPVLPSPSVPTQSPVKSLNLNKTQEQIMMVNSSDSKYNHYRKLKRERFDMRMKAKIELEKLKKSYAKEKELFVRRKSQEKRLRIKYLQLKVKIKELKVTLLRKKLSKL